MGMRSDDRAKVRVPSQTRAVFRVLTEWFFLTRHLWAARRSPVKQSQTKNGNIFISLTSRGARGNLWRTQGLQDIFISCGMDDVTVACPSKEWTLSDVDWPEFEDRFLLHFMSRLIVVGCAYSFSSAPQSSV